MEMETEKNNGPLYAVFPVHWFLPGGNVAVSPLGRDLLERALEQIEEGVTPPDLHLMDGPTFGRAFWYAGDCNDPFPEYLEACVQEHVRTVLVLPVRDAKRLLRVSAQTETKALLPPNLVVHNPEWGTPRHTASRDG